MQKRSTQPMPPDAAEFYASRRGDQLTSLLMYRLASILPDPTGLRILGLGFARPLLCRWHGLNSARWSASAQIDAPLTRRRGIESPTNFILPTCVVAQDCLPFDDLSLDLVLLVHGLEHVDPNRLLRMVWQVLADHGHLIVIVPNRTGLVAKDDTLPFGYGSPFSASRLDHALRQALFRIEVKTSALNAPVQFLRLGERTALTADKVFSLLGRRLGGVHLVSARKDVYSGIPLEAEHAGLSFGRRAVALAGSAGSCSSLSKVRKA